MTTKGEQESMKNEALVTNCFLRLGYFCRPHIQIYPQSSTSKVSDIDAFGIRFDKYLAIAEVKHDSQRIMIFLSYSDLKRIIIVMRPILLQIGLVIIFEKYPDN